MTTQAEGRLTKASIEHFRIGERDRKDLEAGFIDAFCDLALLALSAPSEAREVALAEHKDAVLEQIVFICNAYANEGYKATKEYVHETVAELIARFRALKTVVPARVAEGGATKEQEPEGS